MQFNLFLYSKFNVFIFILLTAIVYSCNFTDPLPEIPVIEYKKHTLNKNQMGIDTSLILFIDFSHGSGRLGLDQEDTLPPFQQEEGNPYRYNFYAEYYEKIDGEFQMVTTNVPFSTDTIHFHGRFPKIEPDGENKSIRGTIEYFVPVRPIYSDTIQFIIWIIDRDLIESNKVESPAIVVNRQ